jgi:signal transduction histidine kinase
MEKQKTEFVSIASHQLRTPLTAIKGYASMLLEGSFGKLSDGVRDAVDKIFKSSQVLVLIIEDFLMVSRIEQGRMRYDFTVVNLRDTVKEVVKDIEPKAKEKNLSIQVYVEDTGSFNIKADHAKIKQVIYNVVNNAILYTEKGFIKILLSKNKESDMLRVAVSDTGIGIDRNMMSKLFKKFSKGKESTLGSGIGLYVAKEIVKAHKGHIWAQSDGKTQGSTFFIELPEIKKLPKSEF